MVAFVRSSSSDPALVSELQALLLETGSLRDFLTRLAELTVRALPEGSSCGVTTRANSQAVTLAASDDRTTRVDELQYEFDAGPCLHTLATGQVSHIVDTVTDTRWQEFCRGAAELGVRSCLALPLNGPTGVVGCYNLYSTHLDGFPRGMWAQLEVFAGNAAGAVAVAIKLADQAKLSEDLHQALASRAVIDRALGILMAQNRCDADAAFDLLRRASQNRNVKVREMAARIVSAVTGAPPKPGRFRACGS